MPNRRAASDTLPSQSASTRWMCSHSSRRGDIGSAVFEIWRNDGGGKISTLKTITFTG